MNVWSGHVILQKSSLMAGLPAHTTCASRNTRLDWKSLFPCAGCKLHCLNQRWQWSKTGFVPFWNPRLNANVTFTIKNTAIFLQRTIEWGYCVNENLALCSHFKLLHSKHKCLYLKINFPCLGLMIWRLYCHWSKRMIATHKRCLHLLFPSTSNSGEAWSLVLEDPRDYGNVENSGLDGFDWPIFRYVVLH